MASQFKYNSDNNIITNTDLQYLTHKESLSIIIDYYNIYGNITKKIKNATALSLQSDGSVDRTHVKKIYTLAKLIDKVGNESLILLGEPLKRLAHRIFNIMIKSM